MLISACPVGEPPMAIQLGFLRLYVHDWTSLKPEMWAGRITEIVERREFYEEPGVAGEKWQWAIGSPEVTKGKEDIFISGVLYKIRKNAVDKVWDTDAWTVKKGAPGVLAAENAAPFTISVKHHMIAHGINQVSQTLFVRIFREILQRGGASAPAMNRLVDKANFYSRVERLEKVTVVTAHVQPTNPIDKRSVAKADGILKAARAAHGTFIFRNEQGLNLEQDDLLGHLLNLAGEGYGVGTVTGVEKGTGLRQRVTTDEQAIRIPVDPLTLADLRHLAYDLIPRVAGADDEPVKIRKRGG